MFQNKLKSENSIRYFNSISLHSNLNDFCICYLNSNLRCDLEFKRFFHSILNVTHCPFRCRVGYLFVFLLCFLLYSFLLLYDEYALQYLHVVQVKATLCTHPSLFPSFSLSLFVHRSTESSLTNYSNTVQPTITLIITQTCTHLWVQGSVINIWFYN